MLCAMRILNSMGLKVKLPMILYLDNKGAKDFINSWSIGGRTRHIEVKQYFLRELKEGGILVCKWKSGNEMESDIFTKNCARPLFEKHATKFVGHDEYMAVSMDHGTPKGRVSEVECCEYHGGTYEDIEVSNHHEYVTIMESIVCE